MSGFWKTIFVDTIIKIIKKIFGGGDKNGEEKRNETSAENSTEGKTGPV